MNRLAQVFAALMIFVLSATTASAAGGDTRAPNCSSSQEAAEACQELLAMYEAEQKTEGQELLALPTPTPAPAPVVTGDWAFVEEYKVKMMDAIAFACTDDDVKSVLGSNGGINNRTVDHLNSQEFWERSWPGQTDEFFRLQGELDTRLEAEIEANGGIAPEGVPTEAFSVSDLLLVMGQYGYEGCDSPYFTMGK